MADPVWADATGLPTTHAIKAALRVALLIDRTGSRVVDARETYWHVASGGALPPDDLALGESLLIDLDFALIADGVLHRSTALCAILEGTEASAAASLLLASVVSVDVLRASGDVLRRRLVAVGLDDDQVEDAVAAAYGKFDASFRALIGEIGEDIVVAAARAELAAVGRDDLARAVRRVSLVSDAYGYDVVAPRVHGADRLLEVKSTTAPADPEMTVFLSRHEATVGATRRNWVLVLCEVQDVGDRRGRVLGWLPFESIKMHLPTDTQNGRWETASIRISANDLAFGLPSAFV